VARLATAAERSEGDARSEAERALGKARAAHAKALAQAHRAAAEAIAKLIDADEFAKASTALGATDAAWREGDAGRALVARLNEAAGAAFARVRRRVDEAHQEQDWEAARTALRGAQAWGVAEVTERASTLLATIERLAEDWEGLKRESRELAHVREAALALRADLAKRDVTAARTRCESVAVTAPRAAEALADEVGAVRDAAACADALAGSGRLLKGQPLTLGSLKGEIVRIEGGKVFLKLKAAGLDRPLAELDAATWLDLARRALEAGAKPAEGVAGHARAGWVVLALAAGDAAGAKAAFDAGEWELDQQYRLQGRIEMAPRLEREVRAGRLLAEAEAAVARKDEPRASALLDQLEGDLADTQAVQGAEIRRRDIRRGLERLQGVGAAAGGDDEPGKGGHDLPDEGG
jgi:hypothetical protein